MIKILNQRSKTRSISSPEFNQHLFTNY